MEALVRFERDEDGVVVLTLADPDRRNALRLEMTRALASVVVAATGDGAKAIVLAAEPPVFCAGGSIDDLLQPRAPLADMYVGFLALSACPVPTIAAVGGACVGAGVNLPLACDVIVTSSRARFDSRWLDVGIHPGGAHLRRLSDRVGRQAAAAMVLCGEVLDGQEAVAAGLAWRCVEHDTLLETAVALGRRAAKRDPELVRRTKQTLNASLDVPSISEALALETSAQQWSMERPGFRDRLEAIKASMGSRKS